MTDEAATVSEPTTGKSRLSERFREQAVPVVLDVKDLRAYYVTDSGYAKAVDGVSFRLEPGEVLGLVGESGCGKTTITKAILGLMPEDSMVDGEVLLNDENLLKLSQNELRKIRWTRMSLIAQSAMNALDPVYTIGDQIEEAIRTHLNVTRDEAWERAADLFELVGLAPERLREYPHQFSGGMRQRAVIALSLALQPGLIIGDEPTTALDVIMQDQILERIRRVHQEVNASMILVTHDISVVAETCDSTAVMYAGKMVEYGPTKALFLAPAHPYTMGLKNAFPTIQGEITHLISIPGSPPSLVNPPAGCLFAQRCPFATERCRAEVPPLVEVGPNHWAACHYADQAPSMREQSTDSAVWDKVAARLVGDV